MINADSENTLQRINSQTSTLSISSRITETVVVIFEGHMERHTGNHAISLTEIEEKSSWEITEIPELDRCI